MLKRQTIVFISLFVSTLMLMLTVVPHHHHNGLPCFSVENILEDIAECEHHKNGNDHSCCDHHQHESNSEDETTCALEQLEFITSFSPKIPGICSDCLHFHNHLFLQATLNTYIEDFSIPDKIEKILQPPYLINYHSVYVSQSLGLRAPPVV